MFSSVQVRSDSESNGDLKKALDVFNQKPAKPGFSISYQIDYKELDFGKERQKLGEGSFGVVYKGTYQHGLAAIKQLHIDNLSQESDEEFNKEATVMAQLRHANIVQFYGYCTVPKCLVMEYMPKGSLYSVLHDKKEPLDWNVRIRIAMDMVSGLAFLHSKNILHRDIKSLNVLLDDRAAKLSDFGLSKVKDETKSKSTANKTKQNVGTPQWMAPELFALEGEPVYTHKSDIYSLGITFWELAAYKIPYASRRPETIPYIVTQGKREDIPKDCPEKLGYLIQQCWSGNPEARPMASEIAKFMTTDAKTLEPGRSAAQTSSPAVAFNLQASPASPASPHNALKRRDSLKLNLADKKSEQEKIRYVLEELRTFFIEERDEGEKTENYAVYNEYLKKANPGVQLAYKAKQNKHILCVSGTPLDTEAAIKELSKMLEPLSLAAANVPTKPTAFPVSQPPVVKEAPKVSSPQAVTPLKPPEQKTPPGMLTQFEASKPDPKPKAVSAPDVQAFLKLVAAGEQDQAEAMLKTNADLALAPSNVTDLSGRSFNNITGFQYAIWALDWHMWVMIRKYLPKEKAAEQAQSLKTGSWVQQHGASVSWQNLLDALQEFIRLIDASKWSEAGRQWDKQVGSAQRLLPAHVINEYCRLDRAFEPCPDFNSSTPLPRTRNTSSGEWYNGKLGDTFACVRYSFDKAAGQWRWGGVAVAGRGHATADLKACRTLLATRVQQRDQLFADMSVTYQDQVKAGARVSTQPNLCQAKRRQDAWPALF